MSLQCNYCESKFRNKELFSNHLLMHMDEEKINKIIICIKCNREFPTKVLLNRHISKVHNKNQKFKMKGNKSEQKRHMCVACHDKFQYNCQLKYHIRKEHFNLTGHIPYCELKSINQVWFEKVLNTNIIVEIKKMANNYLSIRKLNENTSIKVTEMERDVFDLRVNYPIKGGNKLLKCRVCSKVCTKKQLHKHFAESHRHLFKNRCDACKTKFKRVFNCIIHVCPRSDIVE